MRRKGYKVGVLDADITGPSIPKLFGVHGPAMGTEDGINPVESHTGIKIMSINLLLEDEEAPVVWRGPVIAGAVKQFWQEVIWDDVDFLFVDMPPGTGDVPLTVFQTLPVDGIIIVSSPQELVGMIVGQGCADGRNDEGSHPWHCGKHELCALPGLRQAYQRVWRQPCGRDRQEVPPAVLAKMPLNPEFAKEADAGMIETFAGDYLDGAADAVAKLLK